MTRTPRGFDAPYRPLRRPNPSTPPRATPMGDCFRYANTLARSLLDADPDTDATVVHGTVLNTTPCSERSRGERDRYEHAWVEHAGRVYDWQGAGHGEESPTVMDFYAERSPSDTQRYTPEEALTLMVRTGHHGPWTVKPEYDPTQLHHRVYTQDAETGEASVVSHVRTAGQPRSQWVPKKYKLDLEFGCLTNAENLAKMNKKLRYVEGWTRFAGTRDKLGAHAWCVAPDGEIVDPYFDHRFPGKEIEYWEDSSAFD